MDSFKKLFSVWGGGEKKEWTRIVNSLEITCYSQKPDGMQSTAAAGDGYAPL